MRNILLSILIMLNINALAQEPPPELITDRPDQTESAATVPKHCLQAETGILMETDVSGSSLSKAITYNTTLLRFGLLDNFELRAGMDYSTVDRTISGFSPLYTGFKVKIADENGCLPQVAFLGGLNLPFTAREDRKPDFSAPGIRFAFAHTLTDRISVGYNLGAEWDGFTAEPGYFYSAAVGIGITEQLGVFAESYGLIRESGNAEHLADAGLTWLLGPALQLDISGGIGLSEAAIRNFFSFGLSYRMDLRWMDQ